MGGKESAVLFAAAQFAGLSKADEAHFIVPIVKSNRGDRHQLSIDGFYFSEASFTGRANIPDVPKKPFNYLLFEFH